MPELFAANHRAHGWSEHAALAGELLGDDPVGITEAIKAAVCPGAAPADLGRARPRNAISLRAKALNSRGIVGAR